MIRQLIISLILILQFWHRARRAAYAESRAKRLRRDAYLATVDAKLREIQMLEIKARMRRTIQGA